MSKLLIANRGEIAIRIARAADALGIPTVAVFATDDAESLHVRRAGSARPLGGQGAAAYLDIAQIVAVAREAGCTAVHPGYGFLSENAAFARACAQAGLTFVGPSPEVLELFGDKTAARTLARERGVPIIPGTNEATSLAEVQAFAAEHGAVMIKALAGGGGRGMREVVDPAGIADAYAVCAREAEQAFANGDLFVEKLVRHARHIEVQIVGDGSGRVVDLGERDCTVQLHHQKLLEMAPSPALTDARRQPLLEAARKLAAHVKYAGLGTFEFLVTDSGFWFIEANPRLQVEHTVTEEVTGVDLVRAQIRIALGASLADVGLAEAPPVRGFAVQARVNLQTISADGSARPAAGTLTAFTPPSGPGVRVDTYGYRGYCTSLRYDSLLAKIIVRDRDVQAALAATDRALAELEIEGVATNVGLLRNILHHPAFADGTLADVDTAFVNDHAAELAPPPPVKSASPAAAAPSLSPSPARSSSPPTSLEPGDVIVQAPMQAVVARILVEEGDRVRAGAALVQLEAMKMEHVLRAERGGIVRRVLVQPGDMVDEDAPLLHLTPSEDIAAAPAINETPSSGADWSAELREIDRRVAMADTLGGADKIERQHAAGRLTVRERIAELVDPGSFGEIGRLAGFGEYDAKGVLVHVTPTNFLVGTARIDQRRVMIGADDFTGRGGSGDAAIWEKQIHSEELAGELRLPMVRLLDGASGGGSVKMVVTSGFTYVPVNPGLKAVVENLSLVPVVAACLGPTVGLGAARLVMSHFAIMVEGIGQVFTAGPPVVHAATGENLTKEQLGGAAVHRRNGVVERIVASEAEAFALIRRFLSYLPVERVRPAAGDGLGRSAGAARREPPLRGAAQPARALRDRSHPRRHLRSRLGAPLRRLRRRHADGVRAARRSSGRRARPRSEPRQHHVGRGRDGRHPLRRSVRDVPPPAHQPHRHGRRGDRPGRGEARHPALRRARHLRRVPGEGAASGDHPPSRVRRRRRRDGESPSSDAQLGLALGRLGLASGQGRRPGGLPRAAGEAHGSGRARGRDRAPRKAPLRSLVPLSHRRALRRAGPHRSARQPRSALRVGARRLRAPPRASWTPLFRHATLTSETTMNEQELIDRLRAEGGELVTERLEHWAKVAGERTALYYGEDDLTVSFAELAARADCIAGNLAAQGITKGDRVCVFSTNPLISTFLMYGIWRAGALYCPVNFAYSGRLLTYQLDDTAPVLVVTDGKLLPALNEVFAGLASRPRVSVYEAPPRRARSPRRARRRARVGDRDSLGRAGRAGGRTPDVRLSMSDAANVVYTSGTTGAAKGVVHPHRWLAQYSLALRLPIADTDVVYNDLPMYHVGGAIANVVRAMWAGAECALWDRFSPTDFWRRIEKRGATAAILVDVMMPWLMKAPESPDDRGQHAEQGAHAAAAAAPPGGVRSASGSTSSPPASGRPRRGRRCGACSRRRPPARARRASSYRGMSHEQIRARAAHLGIPVLDGAKVTRKGLMGRATPFVEVSIRDDNDDECAVEQGGQLALRSKIPHLFLKEYLGKAAATAAAFKNLWFHTGDAAVQGEDGNYYFVDRMGDRMRVRGENLSSFQVEDMLNQHEGIQFSAVFAVPGAEGDEDDIVAFVVATPGTSLEEATVHAFALETMPKFMRPRHVRIIDDLPRTPTNKVEKYRLRQRIQAELGGAPGKLETSKPGG